MIDIRIGLGSGKIVAVLALDASPVKVENPL
jgi:hypothetical protein